MSESMSEQTGIQGLSTAILLPSMSLFGERPDCMPMRLVRSPAWAIGLFQRTVSTLQRAGIRQLIVLVGPEEISLNTFG